MGQSEGDPHVCGPGKGRNQKYQQIKKLVVCCESSKVEVNSKFCNLSVAAVINNYHLRCVEVKSVIVLIPLSIVRSRHSLLSLVPSLLYSSFIIHSISVIGGTIDIINHLIMLDLLPKELLFIAFACMVDGRWYSGINNTLILSFIYHSSLFSSSSLLSFICINSSQYHHLFVHVMRANAAIRIINSFAHTHFLVHHCIYSFISFIPSSSSFSLINYYNRIIITCTAALIRCSCYVILLIIGERIMVSLYYYYYYYYYLFSSMVSMIISNRYDDGCSSNNHYIIVASRHRLVYVASTKYSLLYRTLIYRLVMATAMM
jgi:hypothetical protein